MKPVARKRFGQHFLVDPAVVQGIVAAIAPGSGQCMVEIGPGPAALTSALLDKIERLHAVEIDRDLFAALQKRFDSARLDLHLADALDFDFPSLLAAYPGTSKLRLVGNLPYNISSPLLIRCAQFSDAIEDMHFMLQKEVVERICAQPGSSAFGRLTVALAAHFRSVYLFEVPPVAFDPPPKVDSAVVRLVPKLATERLGKLVLQKLDLILARAFAQKRKMIRSTLLPWLAQNGLPAGAWESLGIQGTERAEDLAPETYFTWAKALEEKTRTTLVL